MTPKNPQNVFTHSIFILYHSHRIHLNIKSFCSYHFFIFIQKKSIVMIYMILVQFLQFFFFFEHRTILFGWSYCILSQLGSNGNNRMIIKWWWIIWWTRNKKAWDLKITNKKDYYHLENLHMMVILYFSQLGSNGLKHRKNAFCYSSESAGVWSELRRTRHRK